MPKLYMHFKFNKKSPKQKVIILDTFIMSLPHYIVDMRSDTVSSPTIEMREAMYTAAVGDDVYGEDPTVLKLEQKSIDLFKKEAALFVPTGAAQIAGVQLTTIQNRTDGTFCLDELQRKMHLYDDCHEPLTSLIVVENTHNMCGGKVLPLRWLDELVSICKNKEMTNGKTIALHMDGARVFNAAQYLNESVARIARDFDSICFCLSKGLSAPVGSVLLGSKTFIAEARRLRKVLGGGMRQCGILAAAGLVALEKIVPLLPEDHRRTRRIAQAINNLRSSNFNVDLDNVHTNILLIHMMNPKISASSFGKRLAEVTQKELDENITTTDEVGQEIQGIQLKVSSRDWSYARIVLYNQITDKDIEYAIKKIEYVIQEYDRNLVLKKIH
uniref:Aromatic amino acid beta-eliminating lyase/threonine aldolase domain-containing protein n=1 Tax=Glossina morsitans morsitans TaxID=37546 RepID=A0A1B0FBV5_GLOMM